MKFNPKWCRNESEVESKLIVQFLLPYLGYNADDWYQEVTFAKIRLDFLVIPVKFPQTKSSQNLNWCIIIEAKHPKENLRNHLLKFRRYLNTVKVKYGLITNGKYLVICERVNAEIHLIFQCKGEEIVDKIETISGLIGKQTINQKAKSLLTNKPTNKLIDTKPVEIIKNNNSPSVLIQQEKQNSMKIIAIYHNKGGVGKTTTVVNLAAALAKKGLKILIIDLDTQANTTYAVGLATFIDEEDDNLKDCYIYHLIKSGNTYFIPEVIRKTTFTNNEIDAIPSHIDLMSHEKELFEVEATKTRLAKKLQKVQKNYDVVLIDTPPSLNFYAKIALITTDYLIIPSDLKPFANEGLRNLRNFLDEINEFRVDLGKGSINILGVLPTKISSNAQFVKHTLPKRRETIIKRYNFPLFDTDIYEREDIAKAVENVSIVGDLEIPNPRSVLDFKPDSLASAEFEMLALEVMQKIGVTI